MGKLLTDHASVASAVFINEYKVFLRCLPVYGGTTSATIRWCNGASPKVFHKKHVFPERGNKKKKKKNGLEGPRGRPPCTTSPTSKKARQGPILILSTVQGL